MEWLTNLELLAIIFLLLRYQPKPEPPPEETVQVEPPTAPTQARVRVFCADGSSIAWLRPDHPDLKVYRDAPGYWLEHPDGTIEAGRQ